MTKPGHGQGHTRGGAGQGGAGPAAAPLTLTLAVLQHIAWLTGERLVAAEGADRVHAVLAPAARV